MRRSRSRPCRRCSIEGLARSADRAVFDFRDRAISYRELADKVDRLAAAFLARGIGPGSAVGLYLPNTPYHPIAFFACMKAGIRAVHMSALEAERELAHKLKDSGARVLVTTNWAALLPKAEKLKESGLVDLLLVGDDADWGPGPIPLAPMRRRDGVATIADFIGNAGGTFAAPRVAVDDVALLQYTGGTTGLPKGAMLTHAQPHGGGVELRRLVSAGAGPAAPATTRSSASCRCSTSTR